MKCLNILGTIFMALGGIIAAVFTSKGNSRCWRGFPWWYDDDKIWIKGKPLVNFGYILIVVGLVIYILS
jgi:hypothetical protein